jgi:hypothetical protein
MPKRQDEAKNIEDPAPEIADLVAGIRAAQARIDQDEADAIVEQVRIGRLLVDLQKLAGRQWTALVRELGYHARTASRYQKLGASWWADRIGTQGTDWCTGFPPDLQKLEWLCRLSDEQLRALLAKLDPKKASRPAIRRAVQDILGIHDPLRSPSVDMGRLVRSLTNAATRLIAALEDQGQEGLDPGLREELCGTTSALAGLHTVLEVPALCTDVCIA